MRVGEVGAGHADHVDLALAHRMPRGGDIVDLRGMEHGEPRATAHHACELEVRRRWHAVQRDHLAERSVVGDVAAYDVDEVDEVLAREALEHRDAGGGVDAVGQPFVDHHANSHDEVVADPLSDGAQHFQGEAQPALERPAPLVVAMVGGGGEELVEEVAVPLDLEAVHAAGLHALGRVGVVVDGATTGSQSSCPQPVRRPRWLIWIIAAQSCSWMASVMRRIHGTMSSE